MASPSPTTRKPLWRQVFDTVDGIVTPQLESYVQTEQFSKGVGRLGTLLGFVETQARQNSAKMWHLLNLPAGSDVSRLRKQLGALDREVRRLTLQLEQERRAPEAPAVQLKEINDDIDVDSSTAA